MSSRQPEGRELAPGDKIASSIFIENPAQEDAPAKSGDCDRIRSHLGWGLGGFLLGVVCWNFLGFWGFLETAILTAPGHSLHSGLNTRTVPPAPQTILETASFGRATSLPGCTELVRDRLSGQTRARACRTDARDVRTNLRPVRPLVTAQRMDSEE